TNTATRTASATPTATATRTPIHSATASSTATATPTRTPTRTSSVTPTASPTRTPSSTRSPTTSASPSLTPTPSRTASPTPTNPGPRVVFFGVIKNSDGCAFCCDVSCVTTPTPTPMFDTLGRQIFETGSGQFVIVVEGGSAPSGATPGKALQPA